MKFSAKQKIILLILVIGFLSLFAAITYFTRPYYPTIHEYILSERGAIYVPPEKYKINGYKASCKGRPTVLDKKFDSWGGAYPGYIIINPIANKGLATTIRLYIYYHECGHQFTGINEMKADNFAILQGLDSGWLTKDSDMQKICHFVSKIPADALHKDGKTRCKAMTSFFNKKTSRRTGKHH